MSEPSKPFGICWCDCHMPVDDEGKRLFVNAWPRFDDAVAVATACEDCAIDHHLFITTGRDWMYSDRPTNRGPFS